ncbi:carboxypeptidase-like regulatory domain-containing protein [Hymenobacter sp. DH14]|uniref:Carboxypeptidase-like regulatory domain-containing protein n=1 Tax=Hymenobacter cyanobacteriorum TaxID=2926463 RepID=A0A9X2ADL3_9BACT|nr:carboxypeptidase-like regulatory domain-containing protein [Hymenobacter cyanobacteriorum]MCI1186231.1 carboxypeptidase-like regulatory domain-containing protein [Hymenobacter cyanobacteriorum]
MTRLSACTRGLALAAALLSTACSEKPQDAPTPARPAVQASAGLITGAVQPADAVIGVNLTDNATGQTITGAAVDSQTGTYRFEAVPAGTYMLYFDKKPGYVRPRQQSVTVAAGKTTVVPTVAVVQSTAAFAVDGAAFRPPYIDLSLGFDGKAFPPRQCFSIAMGDGLGFSPTSAAGSYILFLTMPYAVQVGTYPLNADFTYAVFTDLKAGTFDSRLNPAPTPGGTLTITAVENTPPFPRSVSGTFSFTATNATTGTAKTFSGTFANAYF